LENASEISVNCGRSNLTCPTFEPFQKGIKLTNNTVKTVSIRDTSLEHLKFIFNPTVTFEKLGKITLSGQNLVYPFEYLSQWLTFKSQPIFLMFEKARNANFQSFKKTKNLRVVITPCHNQDSYSFFINEHEYLGDALKSSEEQKIQKKGAKIDVCLAELACNFFKEPHRTRTKFCNDLKENMLGVYMGRDEDGELNNYAKNIVGALERKKSQSARNRIEERRE